MANSKHVLLLLLCTAVIGLLVAATSLLLLVAGGHGWTSSALSATALLSGPAGATAWSFRNERVGRQLAVWTIAVNAVVDLTFVALTLREGLESALDTWNHLPVIMLAWATAWVSLQVLLPVLALVRSNPREKGKP